jgi:hypothetical protein
LYIPQLTNTTNKFTLEIKMPKANSTSQMASPPTDASGKEIPLPFSQFLVNERGTVYHTSWCHMAIRAQSSSGWAPVQYQNPGKQLKHCKNCH